MKSGRNLETAICKVKVAEIGTPEGTPERPKKGIIPPSPERKTIEDAAPTSEIEIGRLMSIACGRDAGTPLMKANDKYLLAPLCSQQEYQEQLDILLSVAGEDDDDEDMMVNFGNDLGKKGSTNLEVKAATTKLPPTAMAKGMEVIKKKPSEQQNELEGTTTDGKDHDSASYGSSERGHRSKRTVITTEQSEEEASSSTKKVKKFTTLRSESQDLD